MKRVLAIGVFACALTGCGTVQNFERGSLANATVYGGVDIAAERLKAHPIGSGYPPQYIGPVPAPDSLCAADVALSAVGDTLTLPVTVSLTVWRVVSGLWALATYDNTDPPANNRWREFWYNDQPPVPEAPPVSQTP